MFVLERLIDLAARRHGFDRLDLRRRNLVPPAAMPYAIPSAWSTTAAIMRPRWIGRRARRLGGIRGAPRGSAPARAAIAASASRTTSSSTPARRASAPRSPSDPRDGSSSSLGTLSAARATRRASPRSSPNGSGSISSGCAWSPATPSACRSAAARSPGRSMRLGGASWRAPPTSRRARRRIAAWLLEAAEADVEFVARALRRHRDRSLDRPVRGRRGRAPRRWPDELRGPLTASRRDHERAVLRLRLRGVRGRDRPGDGHRRDRALYLGRRLRARREPDDDPRPDPRWHRAGHGPGALGGMPLRSGRASSCRRRSWTTRCPAPTSCRCSSPRSARCRRRPTRSACAAAARAARRRLGAVANAVVDALADLGVEHVELPATPERVWRAIRDARRPA